MFPFVVCQKLNVKIGQLKTLALRLTKEEELIIKKSDTFLGLAFGRGIILPLVT